MISDMNIPSMSVSSMVETFSKIMSEAAKQDKIYELPSFMLWGAPGVGKSQGVRQLAENVGKLLGKKAVVTDARLLLFNPVDLRGIPTADVEKKFAIWLRPKIFDMDASKDVVNFLFLDEITAAPLSVQAAAYQITLDKTIGEHKLPDNCFVIAAGNRMVDKSVTYKMPRALANRLCHVEIHSDLVSFRKWAIKHNIDHRILGYLAFAPQKLIDDNAADFVAFASPRSWEMTDTFIKYSGGDVIKAFDFISGALGLGLATEFRSWLNVYSELPNIDDIFDGMTTAVPTRSDVLYAVTSSMLPYAVKYRNIRYKIDNSLIYATKMPQDFTFGLIRDYCSIEGLSSIVKQNIAVLNWIKENKRYIDDFGD